MKSIREELNTTTWHWICFDSKYQICLANTIGVVDADYYFSNNEGHIFVKLVNRGDKSVHINLGDAFAQGIFMEYGITEDDRVETSRNGGFGSTDKKKE